jgi:hypothetical protein
VEKVAEAALAEVDSVAEVTGEEQVKGGAMGVVRAVAVAVARAVAVAAVVRARAVAARARAAAVRARAAAARVVEAAAAARTAAAKARAARVRAAVVRVRVAAARAGVVPGKSRLCHRRQSRSLSRSRQWLHSSYRRWAPERGVRDARSRKLYVWTCSCSLHMGDGNF